MHPNYVRDAKIASASAASVGGFSPAQLTAAYGFDQVSFGSVAGSGAGQTIAIVDAYDDPYIASDLQAFSAQFSLPQFSSNPKSGPRLPSWARPAQPRAFPRLDTTGWSVEEAIDCERRTPSRRRPTSSWSRPTALPDSDRFCGRGHGCKAKRRERGVDECGWAGMGSGYPGGFRQAVR